MDNDLHEDKTNETVDSAYFGIELKEVGFEQFERRKAPRTNNYVSFVKSLESAPMEVEFSE
jgi:hypothetical protein